MEGEKTFGGKKTGGRGGDELERNCLRCKTQRKKPGWGRCIRSIEIHHGYNT